MFQIMIYPVLSIIDVEKDDIAMPPPLSLTIITGIIIYPLSAGLFVALILNVISFFGGVSTVIEYPLMFINWTNSKIRKVSTCLINF